MASLNKVILIGNLTRDPELRITPKGTAICQFGIAINRQYTNEAGQKQDETTFVDVEAWGKTAENAAKYFTKGKPILIEGRLKLDSWDDKTTGQKRSKLKVVAENWQFVGAKDDQAPQADAPREPRAPRSTATPPPADNVDEDVPF